MKFADVARAIEGVPFTTYEEGKTLYDFIIQHERRNVLELGHAHGVSTCYMAAAVDETGGYVTTVDLTDAADREPNLETLLERAGLTGRVRIARENHSYTWCLKKLIDENSHEGGCQPRFDFVFIDGPKNWTIDGFSFFLVDKLLVTGGWILFDDYSWTYKGAGRAVTDGITERALSPDQIETPNIKEIFRLLVMQHPAYSNFIVEDEWWAWAEKIVAPERMLTLTTRYGAAAMVARRLRVLARRLTGARHGR